MTALTRSNTNELIYNKKETHRLRKKKTYCQWCSVEFRINIYTLLCLKWTNQQGPIV